MRIILIIAAILLVIIYAFSKTDAEITDQYEVLKTIKTVEIRKYKESVNASYYSENEEERNNYFRSLASYIFGENNKNESISMTSPVTMRLYGRKEMIFRMPAKYTLESLPKSNNPNIDFFIIPACTKAAIGYSGYSNNMIERRKINDLKEVLLDNNIIHNDNFEVLVYNSPYKILNRRNEITININYP